MSAAVQLQLKAGFFLFKKYISRELNNRKILL